MKYVLIPLRGAIDSNAVIEFLLLELVNVNWGIYCCVYVCVFPSARLIPNMIGLTRHTLAGMHALLSEKGLLFSVHTCGKMRSTLKRDA